MDGSSGGAISVMNPCITATSAATAATAATAQNLLIKANMGRARRTAEVGVFVHRQIGTDSLFMLSKTHKPTTAPKVHRRKADDAVSLTAIILL